jgi:ABC-2 type transport system ATP-binding protein
MADFLSVHQLTKRYGNQQALDGVSFQVAAGECFGLLGPNGAGKTTLLSILSCLRPADAGSALLLGQSLAPSNRTVRRVLGIAPQEIAVYGSLTARENLAFFGSLYGLCGARLNTRVDSLLEVVGLQGRADSRAETFSGGMLRRLNLAAALVHEPQLLLLDEPTAGVDPQSRHHLFEEIRRCHSAGMTILYTTHYMEEVEALCSRVAIMDHGRIVACDSLPRLLDRIPSQVSLTLNAPREDLHDRLRQQFPDQVRRDANGKRFTITATGSNDALVRVVRILADLKIPPEHLAAQTPNLERVFLQLTGRALRD